MAMTEPSELSPTPAAPPPAAPTGAVRRLWIPAAIVGVCALVITGFWLFPGDDRLPRVYRVAGTDISTMTGVFLLTLWWMFLSGFPAAVRFGLPAAAAVVTVACVRVEDPDFTGDMVPIVHFRWDHSHYDDLDRARRATRSESAPAPSSPRPAAVAASADNYPGYRNVTRDAVAVGPKLARDWKTKPPRLVWKQLSGAGYAGFAVAGTAAVTIEQRRDREAVVCYDADSGAERWVYDYVARFYHPLGGEGPLATPTISGSKVYSLGATGRFVCLELATGALRWEHDLLADNKNIEWGMSGSPLVVDDLVVVNPGEQVSPPQPRAVRAFDKETGKLVWQSGTTRAGYCSPMLASLAGTRQILIFDGVELAGYNLADGAKLWQHVWSTNQGINVAQPILLPDNKLFVTSAYGVGAGVIEVKRAGSVWSATRLWHNLSMKCRFTSPVEYQGMIYGLDEGILACVDPADGKRRWKDGRYGQGQLLRCGDLLLITAENGKLVLVEATPAGHRELGSVAALEADKTWNCPALAGGRAFVRNHREMACYDLRE